MDASVLPLLRCPACGGTLTLNADPGPMVETGTLACACGAEYPVEGGVPNLVHPRDQPFIEEDPDTYDELIGFIARLLRSDEAAVRRRAVEALEVKPGDRVLEVGCGPGSNFPYVFERIGRRGELFAADISPGMIRRAAAREVIAPESRHLFLVNGVHLPFPDGAFDAVLQIGTLNRFADIPAALREMARVTKRGGKVVAGDEALGAWLHQTEYAALLRKFGGLFKGQVPIGALPINADEVRVRWDLGHAYYVIDFRVGTEPSADLDVRLPGRDVTVRDVLTKSQQKA
ncbi:MAG TPA: methyltransferase domain-containing protein [Vicinamibacterales bacterium]